MQIKYKEWKSSKATQRNFNFLFVRIHFTLVTFVENKILKFIATLGNILQLIYYLIRINGTQGNIRQIK